MIFKCTIKQTMIANMCINKIKIKIISHTFEHASSFSRAWCKIYYKRPNAIHREHLKSEFLYTNISSNPI